MAHLNPSCGVSIQPNRVYSTADIKACFSGWAHKETSARRSLFFIGNTELGEEEGSIVQEIIVCVLTITPLNVTDFQSLGNTLSFGEEKVICHVI